MAITQKYGIKYPFTTDNDDATYIDLNETYGEGIQSQVLHVIFTPKGQKLRDPDLGQIWFIIYLIKQTRLHLG